MSYREPDMVCDVEQDDWRERGTVRIQRFNQRRLFGGGLAQ
jgi:hypothetical protein